MGLGRARKGSPSGRAYVRAVGPRGRASDGNLAASFGSLSRRLATFPPRRRGVAALISRLVVAGSLPKTCALSFFLFAPAADSEMRSHVSCDICAPIFSMHLLLRFRYQPPHLYSAPSRIYLQTD